MKKIILVFIIIFAISGCVIKNEPVTNKDHGIPDEAVIIKEKENVIYLKIGKRYYIRYFHGSYFGYTVYEVDKEVIYQEEKKG